MTPLVALSGLGDFGRQLAIWIRAEHMDVTLIYAIDPDETKHIPDVQCFCSIEEVPSHLLHATDVVIDCASKGSGRANLASYRKHGLPAVFQNGEDINLCHIFHNRPTQKMLLCDPYLKIMRCSGLMGCAVIYPILAHIPIQSAWACVFKVNDRDQMLTMDYQSGKEIQFLTGVPSRVDVVYLRGKAHNGYAYHGVIQLECEVAPHQEDILKWLSENVDIEIVHDTIDTCTYPRGTKTLIIEEGIEVHGTSVRIAVLSFTPEINFPQNEAAIHLLAKYTHRR